MHQIRMYSRRTCGLCDEARTILLEVRRQAPFHFEETFIDGDDVLEREYGLRVPVILLDGSECFEYAVDGMRLRSLLRA